MEKKYTLVYNDIRKRRFVELFFYNCGSLVLSRPGQELMVKKAERDYLLKLKNGSKSVFLKKQEVLKMEVKDNGFG